MINYTEDDINIFSETLEEIAKTYPKKALAFNEGFLLYNLLKLHKIDMFIESGVCAGGSTRLIATTLPNLPIKAVDTFNARDTDIGYACEYYNVDYSALIDTIHKAFSFAPNVEFIQGDGTKVLPELIENNPELKIGVLVDGPKGNPQKLLMEKCIGYDNVTFVCGHDLKEKEKTNKSYVVLHSWDDSYKNLLRLNTDLGYPQLRYYPRGPGLLIYLKQSKNIFGTTTKIIGGIGA